MKCIQNHSTVTYPTMEPYFNLLLITLPWRTMNRKLYIIGHTTPTLTSPCMSVLTERVLEACRGRNRTITGLPFLSRSCCCFVVVVVFFLGGGDLRQQILYEIKTKDSPLNSFICLFCVIIR